MTPKTIWNILGGIAATVILGAVGSGVWERLLSPALDWMFRTSVDLVSTVSLRYKNGIYEAAAKGFHEDYSLRIFAIALLFLSLFFLIYAMRKHDGMNQRFIQPLLSRKGLAQWIAVVASIAFALMVFYSVARHQATNQITTYSIQSMDILRPYIGEEKYILFRSNFLLIKSADQFERFNLSLIQEAKAGGVSLPDFEPL